LYKVAYILIVIFLTAGCSALRSGYVPEQKIERETEPVNLLKTVKDQNVTLHNFFIQKAQIEISSNAISENFLASVKFVYPDTFLISVRSKAGIEAARIFYTRDTILINDRINRQFLYGKPRLAGRKYRIAPETLQLVMGDLISENNEILLSECVNGLATLNVSIHGSKIKYIVDCEKGKVASAIQEGSLGSVLTVLSFDRFIRDSEIYYPSRIIISNDEVKVNIRIEKLEYPYSGNIEFIPGKNYELIELL